MMTITFVAVQVSVPVVFISKRNNLTELHVAIHAIRNGYGYFPLNLNKMDASLVIILMTNKNRRALHKRTTSLTFTG